MTNSANSTMIATAPSGSLDIKIDYSKRDSESVYHTFLEINEVVLVPLTDEEVTQIKGTYDARYKELMDAYASAVKAYDGKAESRAKSDAAREKLYAAFATDGALGPGDKAEDHFQFYLLQNLDTQEVLLAPKKYFVDGQLPPDRIIDFVPEGGGLLVGGTVNIKRSNSFKVEGVSEKDPDNPENTNATIGNTSAKYKIEPKIGGGYEVVTKGQMSTAVLGAALPLPLRKIASELELDKTLDKWVTSFNEACNFDLDTRKDTKEKIVALFPENGDKWTDEKWAEIDVKCKDFWQEESPVKDLWPKELSQNMDESSRTKKELSELKQAVSACMLPPRYLNLSGNVALMQYTGKNYAKAELNLAAGSVALGIGTSHEFNLAEASTKFVGSIPSTRGYNTAFTFEAQYRVFDFHKQGRAHNIIDHIFQPYSCELTERGSKQLASLAERVLDSAEDRNNVTGSGSASGTSGWVGICLGVNESYALEGILPLQTQKLLQEYRYRVARAYITNDKSLLESIYDEYNNNLLNNIRGLKFLAQDSAAYEHYQKREMQTAQYQISGHYGSFVSQAAKTNYDEFRPPEEAQFLPPSRNEEKSLAIDPTVVESPVSGSSMNGFEAKTYRICSGDGWHVVGRQLGVPAEQWNNIWQNHPHLKRVIHPGDKVSLIQENGTYYVHFLPKGERLIDSDVPLAPRQDRAFQFIDELLPSYDEDAQGWLNYYVANEYSPATNALLVGDIEADGSVTCCMQRVATVSNGGEIQWSEDKRPVTVSAGCFRFDIECEVKGSVGASFALSGDININTGMPFDDAAIEGQSHNAGDEAVEGAKIGGAELKSGKVFVTPSYNPQSAQGQFAPRYANEEEAKLFGASAYAGAKAEAFAGAKGSASIMGKLLWQPPKMQYNKVASDQSEIDESKFKEVSSLGFMGTAAAGIGGSANFKLGYDELLKKFIFICKAELVYGVGAGGEVKTAVDVAQIVTFFKLVYDQLFQCDFRIANIFDDALDVYERYCAAVWGLFLTPEIKIMGASIEIPLGKPLELFTKATVYSLPELLDEFQNFQSYWAVSQSELADRVLAIYESGNKEAVKYAPPEVLGSWLYQILNDDFWDKLWGSDDFDFARKHELAVIFILENGIHTRKEFNEVLEHIIENQSEKNRTAAEKSENSEIYAKRIKSMLDEDEDLPKLRTWFRNLKPYQGVEPILPCISWL